MKKKDLPIVARDPWLQPFAEAIEGRHRYALSKYRELTDCRQSLADFASHHLYYGLHRNAKAWVFREWAPNATKICLVGDFNGWQETEAFCLQRLNEHGDWEVQVPAKAIHHGDLYKMMVYWDGGSGERIPAWCTRTVQDDETKIFCAQVWAPRHPY